MGVCLNYKTTRPVTPAVVDAIRAELPAICAPQPWILCEAPGFHEIGPDGHLSGFSKLNLMPDPADFAESRDFGNEAHDLRALLDALVGWSSRHGLDWDLEIDGDPLGAIVGGQPEAGLRDRLDDLADLADALGGDPDVFDDDESPNLTIHRPPG